MSAADGGPAFPALLWQNVGDNDVIAPDGQLIAPGETAYMPGMTLRDYFAAKAMQTLLGRVYSSPRDIANAAYGMADEMLIAGAT